MSVALPRFHPRQARALAALIALGACGCSQADDRLLVGVLEEVPPAVAGDHFARAVRVAFRHTREGWESFPSDCKDQQCLKDVASKYPAVTEWTISLDGRVLGSVTAQTPKQFDYYASIGLQPLSEPRQAPSVGKADKKYSGFLDIAVHRPLLASSGKRKSGLSPVRWLEARPDAGDLQSVSGQFVERIPNIGDCRPDSKGGPVPSEGRAPRDSELEVRNKWVNRKRDAILYAAFRERPRKHCEGPPAHPRALWFYREHGGPAKPLPGQLTNDGLELSFPIAFTDFLGDGKSEALFFAEGYNRGGYVLFYDEFRERAVFSWGYH